MLLHGQSSLVHAGGYPFLIGLPFRAEGFYLWLGNALPYVLLILQHAIDGIALIVLYRISLHIYGLVGAGVTVLLAGLNLQSLACTSATYPEWLQSDLLVFSLSASYFAYRHEEFRAKRLLYGVAAFAFTWCVLVKFNVAVLGWFLILAIALEQLNLKRKLVLAGTCALVAVATVVPYLRFYQYSTTGTYKLTYDTAWVLLSRVQFAFGNTLDPNAGLNTRRWLALSSVLPRSYEFAGPVLFSRVDAIPPQVRAPYRARYGYLVNAESDVVNRVLASKGLPDGFQVGLSAIPVAYYLGLPESDLGARAAIEAVRARPAAFASVVVKEVGQTMSGWGGDALFANEAKMATFGLTPTYRGRLGFVWMAQRAAYSSVPYSFSVPIFWAPGVRLFTILNSYALPACWPSLALGFAVLAAAGRIAIHRRIDLQSTVTLLLALLTIMMIVVSIVTLAFRWKEWRLVLPLVCLLGGAAANGISTIASFARIKYLGER
jgi:hypothetical protein